MDLPGARASWGVRPRILPNPSCKKLCSAHQLLPRLTDCCRLLCCPLFLEPQFPHLGQIALTQPQDEVGQERHPAQGLQASTSASLLSLPGPMVHPSVICLPGCCSKRLRTSGREGTGLLQALLSGSTQEVEVARWGDSPSRCPLEGRAAPLTRAHTQT